MESYYDRIKRDAIKVKALSDEGKIEMMLKDRTLSIDLQYPRSEDGRPNAVEVGMSETRAADTLLISYDFDRDGWSIKQATRFRWEANEEPDEHWVEVAFVGAFASQVDGDE